MAAGGTLILYGDEDRPPIRMSVPQAYLHACVDARRGGTGRILRALELGTGPAGRRRRAGKRRIGGAIDSAGGAGPWRGNPAYGRRREDGPHPDTAGVAGEGRPGFVCLFVRHRPGPFTRKLVAYMYAQGECDQATYEKDWIAFGDMLISGKEPMAEYDRIKGVLAAFLGKRTKSELFEIARANSLLIAPVSTIDDVLQNPQFIAREYWQKVESRAGGKFDSLSRAVCPLRRLTRSRFAGGRPQSANIIAKCSVPNSE